MGVVKNKMHELIDDCYTYQDAVEMADEQGLSNNNEIFRGMWDGIKAGDAPRAYENDQYNEFVRDMVKADLKTFDYERIGYCGPAVKAKELKIVSNATTIPCAVDLHNKHWVIYPAKQI